MNTTTRSLHKLLWSALAAVVAIPAAVSSDWPQFRGPSGLGVSNDSGLPVVWNDHENLVWKSPLPGHGSSSPIAIDGRLYLTCYSGYGTGDSESQLEDLTLHVVCVDQTNGKILWDQSIPPKLPEEKRIKDHGYSGPTPATDGTHLYVFFGKTGVFKFDLAGNQLWQADVGSGTDNWGCGASPVLFDDLVIINASVESESLVALNKNDGREVWRSPGMNRSWSTPHLVRVANQKSELVVTVEDQVLGFDPATGKSLWNCEGIHDYVCPSVVSRDGIAYVIGGRKSRAIAIRTGGRGDVTETHRLWEAKAGANVSSPVIVDDHMYWVSDRNKIAYCLRLADGEVLYSERFPGQPYASALAGDGKVYIVTRNDGTFVLAAKPEFEQLAHNVFQDTSTFNASPIVSNGQLILRSNRFLYCIQ
ncbi:MAG: PQQ-binding-like beta-propeller repeat protein [Bythopirellula sp.]